MGFNKKNEFNNASKIFRISISLIFFVAGLCFASWGSRISSIQQKFMLSDQELGSILFALPVGLVVSLPLSGWLVNKLGSRNMLAISVISFALTLVALAFVNTVYLLITSLIFFGLFCNATNISVNTQAVSVEKLYGKPIMSSFHGIYSIATFLGAGFGTLMIGFSVSTVFHFLLVASIIIITVILSLSFLNDDQVPEKTQKTFVVPEKSLITIGMIAFCSMVIDGAMFDWGVIYFKKIVGANKQWVGAGYTACMCTMAAGRFFADRFSTKYGLRRTLQLSGILSTIGLLITVSFPSLLPSILGFMLIGAGISSVVPTIYSVASKSKIMSPGSAIAAVSTISFVGFLFGPPLIGYIAGLFSLRVSFVFLISMGIGVFILSTKAKIE
ncbi:MFS transporter [Chryseobacterium shigense]|uniref:Fucose permease n=1 Tax=Chryseobacterium shigense TaxID=297244 RepID=A0A1N7I887_9FLAO|nr:MFS transporter [Chryseobacterium shigense]PQA96987.1 MFS transporter [Chryseobacterium shigense]SIS33306.1 Fucose permease [Chryseobacterium shigense]